jgi:hypothetical protein
MANLSSILGSPRWRSALFGAAGGFIAEILSEVALFPRFGPHDFRSNTLALLWDDAQWGALCGLFIGAALGLLIHPFIAEAARRTLRATAISAGLGFVGGMIGLVVGELVFQALNGAPFIARGVGYGIFGAFLGTAQGIARGSARGAINGGIGGAVGGAIGGLMFDLIGLILGGSVVSRIVCITITGFFIGLFVVIFQSALAGGLVKALSGRLEGREFYLDKPVVTIGSAERSDIALFGDPLVLAQHGAIRASQRQHVLALNPGASAALNGARVSGQVALNPEDELVIGNTRLVYRRRGAAASPTPIPAQPPMQTPAPTPTVRTRVCQNCGAALTETSRFCPRCGQRVVEGGMSHA